MGVEQAQMLMFGDVKLTPVAIQLTKATLATMEYRSSVHEHVKYAIDINVDGVKTRDGDVWPCFKILQITNFN